MSVHLYRIGGNHGGDTMLPEIAQEELAAAVDDVAAELLRRHAIRRPPVDALALLRRMGIAVAWDERQEARARFVRLRRGGPLCGTILLRPEPRPERLQWAVAHELGEHEAQRVFAALRIDPREAPPEARERIANRLAGAILLPLHWFARDGAAADWDLLALKERYATASHELIARRMLDCPPPAIVTIYDQGERTFRATNVPGRCPPPSRAERRVREQAHRSGQPASLADEEFGGSAGERDIRAWPIHEAEWKREIVRAGVAEWEID